MPRVPTPAAARYNSTGDPNPPAPTTRTRESKSFSWPLPPTSSKRIWRAYRFIWASVKLTGRLAETVEKGRRKVTVGEVGQKGDDHLSGHVFPGPYLQGRGQGRA